MPEQKISLEQVKHVAKLARLALSEQQIGRLAPQLESILEYVAKIEKIASQKEIGAALIGWNAICGISEIKRKC